MPKKSIREALEAFSIREALEAFFEECEKMGTLEAVLEESGFSKINDSWESRKPIEEESLALAF